MLTKKTKYALKALHYLAEQPSDQPVLIAELSRAEQIPKKFLEFILLTLRKAGILQSRIGKGGGYWLALAPQRITIASVVRALEGDFAPVQCLSESNYVRCEECRDEQSCGIRLVMSDVNQALTTVMERLTLADMVERSERARLVASKTIDFSI